ncbi:TolB family protein [Cypionkella psychrotolerans]|uniref:TolB family protein n=1 Tax=Cypionkella psychrotolerans TaxID=1678131 RepID=UPI0006B61789|nr:TolB family protein [Cypionkella psychrotolerans]
MRCFLEIYDLASETSRVVLQTDRHIEAPNWDPSGETLLINAEGRLFRVALDAPALAPVETGVAVKLNNDHGISPDGSQIVISSHHEGQGSQIYLLPAKGGDPIRISPEAPSWWHGWSADGKVLAYVAARGEKKVIDVYTLPLGGVESRLTMGEGHCDGPDFSADGRQIYYNCDRDGHAQIWVMAADGTGQRKLFADDYVNWFPHPSPDGQHLLYLAYPPGTLGHPANLPVALCLCDLRGENRRRILEFIGGQGTMNVPNWAPDSSAFAYVRYEP